MTLSECISRLRREFEVLDVVECDSLTVADLYLAIKCLHRDTFRSNQRILFTITKDTGRPGQTLQNLQSILNDVDISNFFVCLLTTNPDISDHYKSVLENISIDPVPFHLYQCQGEYTTQSNDTLEIFSKVVTLQEHADKIKDLRDDQRDLLFKNKSFCMLAWTGINIEPDNRVRPCCEFQGTLGDASNQTLDEIWNSEGWRQTRKNMLAGQPLESCTACYQKEQMGRDTLRKSSNRSLLDKIDLVDHTESDGYLEKFKLGYWDIRYNNLCNLTCRSCNPRSSSSWYQPAEKLGLIEQKRSPILIAGKNENDLFDQIMTHVDHVSKIYFAGGEPSMIEKFYNILHVLDSRGRHDVHLCYNINMSRLALQDKSLLDLWKKFPRVSVGASLDGEYERGEYLRQGLRWQHVLDNRRAMIDHCPHVDFYISATISILNVLHLPDFHKSWVDQGLIKPEDFNIQILFSPAYLRVDRCPPKMKIQIAKKYASHLKWLQPRDTLGRATYSFKSVLSYVQQDGEFDRENFWNNVDVLDQYHGTNLLQTFPELTLILERDPNGIQKT